MCYLSPEFVRLSVCCASGPWKRQSGFSTLDFDWRPYWPDRNVSRDWTIFRGFIESICLSLKSRVRRRIVDYNTNNIYICIYISFTANGDLFVYLLYALLNRINFGNFRVLNRWEREKKRTNRTCFFKRVLQANAAHATWQMDRHSPLAASRY